MVVVVVVRRPLHPTFSLHHCFQEGESRFSKTAIKAGLLMSAANTLSLNPSFLGSSCGRSGSTTTAHRGFLFLWNGASCQTGSVAPLLCCSSIIPAVLSGKRRHSYLERRDEGLTFGFLMTETVSGRRGGRLRNGNFTRTMQD